TAQIAAGPLLLLADAGARWRKDVRIADVRFTDVLTFGAAVAWPLDQDRLLLIAEARGETPLDQVGYRAGSPLEALLGLKFSPLAHWSFGAAGGAGLLRGYGSPELRFVLMAGYSSAPDARHAAAGGATNEAREATP